MEKQKLAIIFLLVIGFVSRVVAQDYSYLEKIQLKEKSDYPKNENLVLECSNYLLSSPISLVSNDLNHIKALQFLMRWMEGTPDYSFNIDESIGNATKSNSSLLGIFLASMTKFVIENKDKSKDSKEVKYNSFLIFIDYCNDTKHEVKLNKEIKNLIKAKKEDTLKEYLKI